MVMAAFLAAAGGGGTWIALGGFAGIQERLAGKNAADGTRYMPDQTRLILSLKPADLLRSSAFDALKKEPQYRDNWFVGNSKMFGITASECEQIFMGGTDAETGVFCVKLTRDIDLKKDLLSRPGLKYVETKMVGTAVYDLDLPSAMSLAYEKVDPKELEQAEAILGPRKYRICACTPASNIVLISTKMSLLKSILERDRKPNLPEHINKALGKIGFSKPVVLIMDAKETGFGKNRALGIDPAKLETITVQFAIATDMQFELAMNCADENTASEVEKTTEEMFAKNKAIAALVGGNDAMEVVNSIQFSVRETSAIASLTITSEQAKRLSGLAEQIKNQRR